MCVSRTRACKRPFKKREKWAYWCFVCVYVRSLTPGRPPLLGLHGQRAHHSPHVRGRRGSGTSEVCVSLSRVWKAGPHARTLAPTSSSLFSSSSLQSQQNPYYYHSPFHAFSHHLTVLLLLPLSLPPLFPPTLSIPLPPISLFFH